MPTIVPRRRGAPGAPSGTGHSWRTERWRSSVTNSGRMSSRRHDCGCYKLRSRHDLNDSTSFVTVPRMPRRRTATRRRPTRAQREALRRRGVRRVRRREHRLRRFALLSLVAVVAVVTLALTAFDGSSAQRVVGDHAGARAAVASREEPAAAGDREARRPAPAAAGLAEPRDGDRLPRGRRRLARAAAGRSAGERGTARAARPQALRRRRARGRPGTRSRGGEGPHTSGLDVGARAGTRCTRPSTDASSASRRTS